MYLDGLNSVKDGDLGGTSSFWRLLSQYHVRGVPKFPAAICKNGDHGISWWTVLKISFSPRKRVVKAWHAWVSHHAAFQQWMGHDPFTHGFVIETSVCLFYFSEWFLYDRQSRCLSWGEWMNEWMQVAWQSLQGTVRVMMIVHISLDVLLEMIPRMSSGP